MPKVLVFLTAALGLSTSLFADATLRGVEGVEGSALNQAEIREHRMLRQRLSQRSPARKLPVFPGDNVLSQLVDGAGWSTSLTFINLDTRTLRFTVHFIGDDGNDLLIPVAGAGSSVRAVTLALPVGGTTTVQTQGTSSTLKQGFVYVERDRIEDALGGFGIFRQRTDGRPDFEAVVPIVSEFENRSMLVFDNAAGFLTGVAITNPDLTRTVISVTLRDENGGVLARKTLTMGTFTHLAGLVSELWPETAGKKGSVELSTNGFGVAVLGLRFNPSGAFTSFHVLSNVDWF